MMQEGQKRTNKYICIHVRCPINTNGFLYLQDSRLNNVSYMIDQCETKLSPYMSHKNDSAYTAQKFLKSKFSLNKQATIMTLIVFECYLSTLI